MEYCSNRDRHPSLHHSIAPPLRPRRSAFTLIEILVVVTITLIAAGIAIPSFARAMQGQRLRTSARIIATSHKFARNMAVLRQRPMALLIDRLNNQISMVELESKRSMSGMDMFLDTRAEGAQVQSAPDEKAVDEAEKVVPTISESETHNLENGVKVTDFKSDGDVVSREGVYWINYYPSGMSDGFEIRLTDERGKQAKITADSISGGIEVEYE